MHPIAIGFEIYLSIVGIFVSCQKTERHLRMRFILSLLPLLTAGIVAEDFQYMYSSANPDSLIIVDTL